MSNSSFLFALQLSRFILFYVIVLIFHPTVYVWHMLNSSFLYALNLSRLYVIVWLFSPLCSAHLTLCSAHVKPFLPLCSAAVRHGARPSSTTSGLFARPPARPSRLITVIPRLTCNFERPLLTIFVDILSDYGSDLWVFNCGNGSSPLAALGFRGSGVSQWQGRAAIASQTAITPLWRSAALHCVAR